MQQDDIHRESSGRDAQKLRERQTSRRTYMTQVATMVGAAGLGMGTLGSAAADDDCPDRDDGKKDEMRENGAEKMGPDEGEKPDDVADGSEISKCTTITEPGEYILTQDIELPKPTGCIVIEADDVTFDGGGNTISGSNPAVFIFGDNVTVQNLTVDENNFGIIAIGASNACIADNTVTNTQNIGIQLSGGTTNSTVTRNTVTDNGIGILLDDASENVISDNTVTNNEGDGIVLQFGSNDNDVTGNDSSDNGVDGIFLLESDDNTITQNTANDNGEVGINLIDSDNNLVAENTALGNGIADINDDGTGNNFGPGNNSGD
jgi:parallel beta-helix repeat protein